MVFLFEVRFCVWVGVRWILVVFVLLCGCGFIVWWGCCLLLWLFVFAGVCFVCFVILMFGWVLAVLGGGFDVVCYCDCCLWWFVVFSRFRLVVFLVTCVLV